MNKTAQEPANSEQTSANNSQTGEQASQVSAKQPAPAAPVKKVPEVEELDLPVSSPPSGSSTEEAADYSGPDQKDQTSTSDDNSKEEVSADSSGEKEEETSSEGSTPEPSPKPTPKPKKAKKEPADVPSVPLNAPLKVEENSSADSSGGGQAGQEEEPPKIEKKNKKIFIVGVAVGIILILITLGLGYFYVSSQKTSEETSEEEVIQEVKETPSPSPKPSELNRADWTIEVQNGSGIGGAVSELKEILEKLGYKVLAAGNADSSDYEETEIFIDPDKIDGADAFLEEMNLEASISAKPQELEEGDSEAAVLIIIGKE